MAPSTPLVVLCGDRAPDALVQTAAALQSGGLRVASLCSPAVESALVAAKVPHVAVATPADVQLMLSDRVEAVLALPPSTSDVGAAAHARVAQWVSGAYSFVRTAAWNHKQISVVVDESDLVTVQNKLSRDGSLAFSLRERRALAEKAFALFAELDKAIASSLSGDDELVHDVLLVGNGGREHAIAWKLAQSASTGHIYVAPGNAGTEDVSAGISNVNIGVGAHDELIAFAKSKGVSFCVVGPEAPLIDGLADKMNAAGIPTFGPSKLAAQLEASKAFSKDFMRRNDIPTAAYQNFTEYEKAKEYLDSIDHNIVVKASGIAAGKGVLIPTNKTEAHEALREVMLEKAFGSAGDEVVLEEFMIGEEVSLLAFCDGERVVCMPGVQDHKRISDGDQGPNTGGMGAYGPAPCLTSELERECIDIVERVIAAMKKEGMPYVGVLYPGFMLTPTGPKIVEFNCRFGDPETQVVLPLLHSDLFEIMRACVEHRLERSLVSWKSGAAATIVMASQGYPNSYPKGKIITGLDDAQSLKDVDVFHAGTTNATDGIATSGGRVLAVTAVGPSLQGALDRAYEGVSKIHFEGAQYRSDIGLKGLLHGAKKLKLAVLGSTRGSSMQPIVDAIAAGELNASIDIVVSDKAAAGILERAKTHDIESVALSAKGLSRADFDAQVSEVLRKKNVDLVLLIGYMRILSGEFCKEWENKVLNVHPSLLPDFAGGMDLAVHRAVLDAKKTESGCTVHFVTEQVDAGPIAVQMKCPVLENDTPESLKARVQPLEGAAFLHAIKLAQTGLLLKKGGKKEITYADAGVSIDAGNELVNRIKPLCKSTVRVGCDADLGGFGGIFDLQAAGYDKDTALVACTDGVGTKLRVAQLAKKHDTVGIDLVAMCVNDLIVQGAEPLFFLDYYACGKLEVEEAADVVKGIAEGCRQSDCGLIGGETAEMPSMYHDGDYDMAGFCVGAVRKNAILPLPVEAGFAVLGLASSGVHSNGFSLVRKLVEVSGLAYSDPCPFEAGKTLGESLLTPTKIYVKQLMPTVKSGLINALAHITGGGLLENVPRVLTKDLAVDIDCASWPLPPVFKWLQKMGNLSNAELARTFNCGIGMVLLLPEANVAEVTRQVEATGEKVYRLGTTIARAPDAEQVVLHGTMA
ncbi:Phosphoribosylformylglycinamidine cyclo-ligase [Phytophthora citrophthora]|uniref:Trifunctional purine biosynthetic protein adenosine-3 n=1 Tax=Phytophthora citrophthora TaxID=4793 RepID=A0AAD9LCT7_9STRA|nr:Phosphoribosylformylglycinamidine cyclo-ligase [Phytophthora citrophthora]